MQAVIVFLMSALLVLTPTIASAKNEAFAIKEPNPVVQTVTLWSVCYMWEGEEVCTFYMPHDQAEAMLNRWNEMYPEWVGMFYLKSIEVETDDPAITM